MLIFRCLSSGWLNVEVDFPASKELQFARDMSDLVSRCRSEAERRNDRPTAEEILATGINDTENTQARRARGLLGPQ